MNVSKIDACIRELEVAIQSFNENNIKLSANGGNSVLFMCPPMEEKQYIVRMRENLSQKKYQFLDMNKLLVEFIDENKDEIELKFKLLKNSYSQIFRLPQGEEGNDLFGMVISAILRAYDNEKIPVIIGVGALNGTDIENIHIMENQVVMKAKRPLVILYPAEKKNDEILFLGLRPASRYRCMVIGGN